MTIEQVVQLIQLGQVPVEVEGQWDNVNMDINMVIAYRTPLPVEVSGQWDDVPGPGVQNEGVKSDRTKPEELRDAIKSRRCRNSESLSLKWDTIKVMDGFNCTWAWHLMEQYIKVNLCIFFQQLDFGTFFSIHMSSFYIDIPILEPGRSLDRQHEVLRLV